MLKKIMVIILIVMIPVSATALPGIFSRKKSVILIVPDHGIGGPHLVGFYGAGESDSTVVSYSEGGFASYTLDSDGFPVSDNDKSLAVRWIDWTGHTGEDVGIHAMGPGSEKLSGLVQNIDIYHVMAEHLNLIKKEIKDLSEIVDP